MDFPHLAKTDPEVLDLISKETLRQHRSIRLIPSENYASAAVMEATGSVFTNKYSEGYAGKRYYEGQEYVDLLETLAIRRACTLFGAEHANVQPYSGSPANLAVYLAFLAPGDKVMGMSLPHGGHLTHGWKVSITGKFFNSVQYTVEQDTHLLEMDKVRQMALAERPKLLIAGATAYPRILDFAAFASIAREIGAILLVDMAHIAGLVAGGAHPSPVPHADVVTTTTHKTLRGPRGGMILCKEEHAKAIDKAVFPGLQGGPHNHTTAGVAVALHEAATPEFKQYASQVVANAKAFAAALTDRGFRLITGGTDNHLLLVDLTPRGIPGRQAAAALNRVGIVCNSNTIPFDPRKPFDPSGIRLGTPAVTSRGMGTGEMETIARLMDQTLTQMGDESAEEKIRNQVWELTGRFPAPGVEVK